MTLLLFYLAVDKSLSRKEQRIPLSENISGRDKFEIPDRRKPKTFKKNSQLKLSEPGEIQIVILEIRKEENFERIKSNNKKTNIFP